jgi:hypothetical protein
MVAGASSPAPGGPKKKNECGRMAHYRLFYLSPIGRIQAAEIIEADSDENAIREAERRFAQRQDYPASYELWSGPRLVHRRGQ